MEVRYEDIQKLLAEGKVRKVTDKSHGLEIYCYSRSCAGLESWSDSLKAARGLVFDTNGNQVTYPLLKFFNLDENASAGMEYVKGRLQSDSYEVYEKLNGHMAILFYHGGEWHLTTKGSFDMEYISKDREVIQHIIDNMEQLPETRRNWYRNQTLIFEMLVEHDKHLLYGNQTEDYGENVGVLLAIKGKGTDLLHQGLVQCANEIGSCVVKRIDKDIDLDSEYDLTGIEGYIVRFVRDNFRFKIKTKWYIENRYLSKLDDKKMLKLFKKYGINIDKVYDDLQEEVIDIYKDFVNEFEEFCTAYEDSVALFIDSNKYEINDIDGKKELYEFVTKNASPDMVSAIMYYLNKGKVHTNTLKKAFIEYKEKE